MKNIHRCKYKSKQLYGTRVSLFIHNESVRLVPELQSQRFFRHRKTSQGRDHFCHFFPRVLSHRRMQILFFMKVEGGLVCRDYLYRGTYRTYQYQVVEYFFALICRYSIKAKRKLKLKYRSKLYRY